VEDNRLQKLAGGVLQPDHEEDDDTKAHDCEKRDRYVDDRESGRFDERVIHGGFGMSHYDGPLTEECWNFRHGR